MMPNSKDNAKATYKTSADDKAKSGCATKAYPVATIAKTIITLTMAWPLNVTARPVIRSLNLAQATILPENVTPPINSAKKVTIKIKAVNPAPL